MPVEVVIKDEEIAIYIDRKRFLGWLRDVPGALDGESPVPWEGDSKTDQKRVDERAEELRKEDEREGYKTADGEMKDFPNPVNRKKKGDTDGSHLQDEDIGARPDGVNLFDPGPNGVGGTLQDADGGNKKIKELRDWMKAQKFNYRNFCLFLYEMKELAGFKLSTPLIGVTEAKKEPTIFQVALRFYTYWLSAKEEVAKEYRRFLLKQLDDLGVKIKLVEEALDGEEIDPKNLPKGIEVSV